MGLLIDHVTSRAVRVAVLVQYLNVGGAEETEKTPRGKRKDWKGAEEPRRDHWKQNLQGFSSIHLQFRSQKYFS